MSSIESNGIESPTGPSQATDIFKEGDFVMMQWKKESEVMRMRNTREVSGTALLAAMRQMQGELSIVGPSSLRLGEMEEELSFGEQAAIERHIFVAQINDIVDVYFGGIWSIGGKVIGIRDKKNKDLSGMDDEEMEKESPAFLVVRFETDGKAELLSWPIVQCRKSFFRPRSMNKKLCELQRGLGMVHGSFDFPYHKVGPGAIVCWIEEDTEVPQALSDVEEGKCFFLNARVAGIDTSMNAFAVWIDDKWKSVPFETVVDLCYDEVMEDDSLFSKLLRREGRGRKRPVSQVKLPVKSRSSSKTLSSASSTSASKPAKTKTKAKGKGEPVKAKAKAAGGESKEARAEEKAANKGHEAVAALTSVDSKSLIGTGTGDGPTLSTNILQHQEMEEDHSKLALARSSSELSEVFVVESVSDGPNVSAKSLQMILRRIEQLERTVIEVVRTETAGQGIKTARQISEVENRMMSRLDVVCAELTAAAASAATAGAAANASSAGTAGAGPSSANTISAKEKEDRKKRRTAVTERKNAAVKEERCLAALQPHLNQHENVMISEMERLVKEGWNFPSVATDKEYRALRQMCRRADQWQTRDYEKLWPLISLFAEKATIDAGSKAAETDITKMEVGTHSLWYCWRSAICSSDGGGGQGLANWLRAYMMEGLKAKIITEAFVRSLPDASTCASNKSKKDNALDFFGALTCQPKGRRAFQPIVAAFRVYDLLFTRNGFIR